MHPLQSPSHLGSNAASILVIKERKAQTCIADSLRKHAFAIANSVFLALITTFATLMICGLTQPLIILGLVISIILLGVSCGLLIYRGDKLKLKPSIPQGFASIIQREFPSVIYDFVVQGKLSLQELRAVISGLSSGNFVFPSHKCQEKVEKFGLKRLQAACQGIDLPDLEKLLLKSCPLYFMGKFIDLGSRELPNAEGMEPEVYWVCRTGLSSCLDTAFHHYPWLFSRVVSESEYQSLLNHAHNNTWNEAQPIVEGIRSRLIAVLPHVFVDSFHVDHSWVSCCLNTYQWDWLLFLCKHGVSWEQLQLLKEVECRDMVFLSLFNEANGGMNLARLMLVTYPYMHQEGSEFDSSLALLTWDEWIDHYEQNKESPTWHFYDQTLAFLNKSSNRELVERLSLSHIPIYSLNRTTGERTLN
ncbi:membrane protein [Chlamydia psittaci NJ1]|uniref:DUF1389 domain-containing protein n=1 Tax=Chlamydia psittaci TaxID=83554 RepID=UPI00027E5626|nr:DUF1389 domain-containing protein [Chlamydia psittaci]AFS28195.1 hypothetical protein B712_0685 [Chlamydia psittaci NJ1]KPZ36038.1 membrane protein [Chlamydia psittaci NJ1]